MFYFLEVRNVIVHFTGEYRGVDKIKLASKKRSSLALFLSAIINIIKLQIVFTLFNYV